MTRLPHLLVLMLLASPIYSLLFSEQMHNLCHRPYCKCSDSGHPSWMSVNCSIPQTQKLDIIDGDIPDLTTNIAIQGAEALIIGPGALSRLQDIRQLSLRGAKLIVLRSRAAVNLNVINAYIEIEDCEVLRVEERAFSTIRGPLSVTIRNCNQVSLEGEAFSWLLKMNITNVKTLLLGKGVFTLDPTAANVDKHGPGMSIVLTNITTPEIPAQTFGSSAAEIVITKMTIQAIRRGAFPANTYNVVRISECSIHLIEEEAFASKSLINNLELHECRIHRFGPRALQSAISKLRILRSRFEVIEVGAINTTVASVKIYNCEFLDFKKRGFVLSSWNKLSMERNKFDILPSYAIVAPSSTVVHELVFVDNEMEYVGTNSLSFIGQTFDSKYAVNVAYLSNYYGVLCHCNISTWLASAMGTKNGDPYNSQSYCTVSEYLARCYNVPQQNMVFQKFLEKTCSDDSFIKCEEYKTKSGPIIKNPRFPHKKEVEDTLSDRDKKVIGIVIVTALGCVIIVMIFSLIRWMKRRGYCASIKNMFLSNSSCGTLCGKLCFCGKNNGLDNARSISHMSVQEYSERRRLNEPRIQENLVMETVLSGADPEDVTTPMDDKTTQTLPEELTKELLENLKEKLDDPENYVEAREMIEHLYELIKVEESCNANSPVALKVEENIYDLPFQNTSPRIGKNKKQMISVGTRAPSLDKLLPLSPYNRQTALAHEYFEPKDFAVHLYAEITNCDKEKRLLLGTIPDLVEQIVPRGPYLRAVREKKSSPDSSPGPKCPMTPLPSPASSYVASPLQSPSTIKSNKSTSSNSSGKMINRPLPEKPVHLDPEEGPSVALG